MPRSEVYQLRLTSKGKGKLAHLARERRLSIAQMIRSDYELDAETDSGGDGESVSQRPAKASADEDRPVGSTPTPSAHSASEIKRLAMQRHAHLPLHTAEYLVRRELG